MTKNQIIKDSYKYLIYSMLAWDWPTRKIEDTPENHVFFFSDSYKKSICKDLEKVRSSDKCIFLGNKETSTEYNVYERNDGEVIFAFRGSDSTQDWISDFSFFKTDFKNNQIEQALTMSSEDFNKLCIDEYIKSRESLFDKSFEYFSRGKLVNVVNYIKDSQLFYNFDSINIITKYLNYFKDKIQFHGGFVKQYMSIVKELDKNVNKYLNDPNVKKITFAGHSLGSSLAQISYIFQSIKHPDIAQEKFSCHVFGTPRIGNKFLSDFMDESKLSNNLFICNIKSDICTIVPPNSLGFIENKNTVTIDNLKAPFSTKGDHTLFYYLYCFNNKANIKVVDQK